MPGAEQRPTETLIDDLVGELEPVRSTGDIRGRFGLWLLASWACVVALSWATGPFRASAGAELASAPRFLAESLLGMLCTGWLAWSALRLGNPEAARWMKRSTPAFSLAALWVASYALGLAWPTLEPSMAGKRLGCEFQTLLFAMPPLLFGLWLLRSLAPLERAASGAVMGAAAGAVPALLMQFACMYEASHILSHHLLPALGSVVIGALLGVSWLRRI